MLSRRRIAGTAALLVAWATGVSSLTAMASATQRFPVIGCADFRYSFANRWSWGFPPARLCQAGPGLVGIDHAHWRSWGMTRATATGSFVDGLGFEYPAEITAYDIRRCASCDGIRDARSWYRRLHIVSREGSVPASSEGPLRSPSRRPPAADHHNRGLCTSSLLAQGQLRRGLHTSHADRVCFAGRPTPDNVAMNIAPAIAQFHPGVDPATGILIPASGPSAGPFEMPKLRSDADHKRMTALTRAVRPAQWVGADLPPRCKCCG